ncbi:hypothetical protein TCAL_16599 [Tigriopus californicus]|uniref:Chloride channel CLIC-like protein 1 n=2 Tax=Tigriopus californicus TaxID=6832 RepID=A0A553NB99_TIGCA|nr:hypothetical protein TCAL_16599 [Tigriopus californicus]
MRLLLIWGGWSWLGCWSVVASDRPPYASPLDQPPDTAHWINPHDMGGKPLAPSQMLAQASRASKHAPPPTSPPSASILVKLAACSDCAQVAQSLEACQSQLAAATGPAGADSRAGSDPRPPGCDRPFLERYVRFVLRTFRAYEGGILQSERLRYRVQVGFAQSDLQDLQTFVQGHARVTLSDVDRILSDMFVRVVSVQAHDPPDPADPPPPDYTRWLLAYVPSQPDLFWLLVCALTVLVWYLIIRGSSGRRVFGIIFGVSTLWHGTFLYKRAVAKKMADISDMPHVPPECFPSQMGWTSFLVQTLFSSSSRKCLEYHEALMIDPLLEVSPIMAVVETFTRMVLHPLEHLGLNLSKFFRSLSSELSWTASPFVMGFMFLFIILMCIMMFGYRFRLPFFLGALEPHHAGPQATPKSASMEIQALKQEIQLLKQLNENAMLYQKPAATLQRVPSALEPSRDCHPRLQELPRSHSVAGRLPVESEADEYKILSPPPKSHPDSLRKSPKKKLVAKGDVTSPQDTDFEWVTEQDSDEGEDDKPAPDPVHPDPMEVKSKLDFEALNDVGIRNQEYLKKIEEIFEEPPQVDEY